ncbi:MAG TPA: type I restriction enzyme HsdR N-terminal domain-containing protein [Flavobacteriaceae bacterium]|nr:type I restriction enzyme HsdR N-terminal domain-containing protein [Flavobacteriaceae bacterium]
MQQLNFPAYTFRFKSSENKILIFDEIRKKFVRLTPEEWVRQHVIQFLIHQKKYPKTLISVEKRITVAQLNKRYDIVVYTPEGDIQLLVECKAPEVTVSQEVFDQTARYNLLLKADYLMVTNGLQHYYCMMDYENQKYIFKKQLPDFQ